MRFFSSMSVKTKLLGAFLLVSVMLGSVAGYSLYQLDQTNDRVATIYKENLLPIAQLGETLESFTNLRRSVATYFAMADEKTKLEVEKSLAESRESWKKVT